jgi:5-methylthioribose kinase
MARKRTKGSLTEFANNLTSKQICALIQFVDPLTDAQQAEYAAMTDEELLAELNNKTEDRISLGSRSK